MFGTVAGVLSLIAGGVLIILGFSGPGAAWAFFSGGAACILFGALLWEVGSCALSLKDIAKKMGAAPDSKSESPKAEKSVRVVAEMMPCPKCGAEINKFATVCPKCKAKFKDGNMVS